MPILDKTGAGLICAARIGIGRSGQTTGVDLTLGPRTGLAPPESSPLLPVTRESPMASLPNQRRSQQLQGSVPWS